MKVYEYLVVNHKNVFWFWEHDHLLHAVYKYIFAAAQSNASRIIVEPERISLEYEAGETSEIEIDLSGWKRDFIYCFRKIVKRDKIIQQCIIILHTEDDRIECSFVDEV